MDLKRIMLCSCRLVATLAATAALSGCALVRSGVQRSARDLAAGLMQEDDLELAKEGMPAFLLALDAMAAAHP